MKISIIILYLRVYKKLFTINTFYALLPSSTFPRMSILK